MTRRSFSKSRLCHVNSGKTVALNPLVLGLLLLLSLIPLTYAADPTTQERYLILARRFSPIYYQGVGPTPRADYICAFNFDGDWKGDNNWNHCTDTQYRMKAYVYYSVEETTTHFFIHYAAFHARDYKGGSLYGQLLNLGKEMYKKYKDQIGNIPGVEEAQLSHENDMEGCLVIAEKEGEDPRSARVVGVETLAHDQFTPYFVNPRPNLFNRDDTRIRVEDGTHPWIFVEPKGHGQKNYTGKEKQVATESTHITYRYTGRAEEPSGRGIEEVGYDLIPLYSTLWQHAQVTQPDDTYGEVFDYGVVKAQAFDPVKHKAEDWQHDIGKVGSSFRGEAEGKDKARPPWGWFDVFDKSIHQGDWFFNPAPLVKKHYQFDDKFSLAYVFNPYLGITPSLWK